MSSRPHLGPPYSLGLWGGAKGGNPDVIQQRNACCREDRLEKNGDSELFTRLEGETKNRRNINTDTGLEKY